MTIFFLADDAEQMFFYRILLNINIELIMRKQNPIRAQVESMQDFNISNLGQLNSTDCISSSNIKVKMSNASCEICNSLQAKQHIK